MAAQQSNLPLSVVLIDDNQEHLSLMELSIEQAFQEERCAITTIAHLSPAEGLAELVDHPNQIILIDYQLSGSTGVDWLSDFVKAGAGPVILVTSSGDEKIAADAFRAGAADYIIKSDAFLNPTILFRSIKESLRKYKLETTNQDLTKRLKAANKDLNSKNRKLTELTETAHRFVEDVAHEFRTPLTVIKEFASILADGLGGEVNSKQVQYLNYITSSTGDLGGLIDDFLNSSRLRSNTICVSRNEYSVRELIDGVCPMLQSRAASKSITLEFEFEDALPVVYADADKVHRSIINLVVNAIKFSEPGATVRVCAALDHEHAVKISVHDSGPGLPEEAVSELFDRFNRGTAGTNQLANGFGLGLSIVKGLVELNLGSVTLQSTLGQGSVFAFTLPCATKEGIVRGLIAQGDQATHSPIVIQSLGVWELELALRPVLELIALPVPTEPTHA